MIIKNAHIINESEIFFGHIYIHKEKIHEIFKDTIPDSILHNDKNIIDAKGKYIIPGIIDDQVHFREPGLTHKANMYREATAAVAGGSTSFKEMPNTNPQTINEEQLEAKHKIASNNSLANYSFYMGATNSNIDVIKSINPKFVCGVKVFMGSSTGNMLVDNKESLDLIFKHSPTIITTHCEEEKIIKTNYNKYYKKYGDSIPFEYHPKIRSHEACYTSSKKAIDLAKKYNSRLHILHLSTADEIALFDKDNDFTKKHITGEVCVHHLWFNENDYKDKGSFIKWNPAIKSRKDQKALFEGLLSDKLDIIATDHAPHTLSEKLNVYSKAPSGGPMVQHSLLLMLEFFHQQKITLPKIIEKMCHNPAKIFNIDKRGFIKKGYYADLTIIDLEQNWKVSKSNILYHCGWSPLEGTHFKSKITHTIINGNLVYENGIFHESIKGKALQFNRG